MSRFDGVFEALPAGGLWQSVAIGGEFGVFTANGSQGGMNGMKMRFNGVS